MFKKVLYSTSLMDSLLVYLIVYFFIVVLHHISKGKSKHFTPLAITSLSITGSQ